MANELAVGVTLNCLNFKGKRSFDEITIVKKVKTKIGFLSQWELWDEPGKPREIICYASIVFESLPGGHRRQPPKVDVDELQRLPGSVCPMAEGWSFGFIESADLAEWKSRGSTID